jgi:GT2 family glycosyltransferase
MDVSFVIPARNEQHTLRYTVANLYRTMTRRSFEIVVVDDHSDEPLSRHLDPARKVVYMRNAERLGVAKSRNIGARAAGGDLLVFLDAHVCFAPGWLDAVYREEKLLHNGIVTPATVRIRDFAQFRVLSTEPWAPRSIAPGPLRGRRKRVYYGHVMSPLPTPTTLRNFTRKSREAFTVPIAGSAALCVSRDLFFRLGGFEDELAGFGGYEDTELCMRSWSLGYWVAVIPSIQYVHFKAHSAGRIDFHARPFYSAYYEQHVENALRIFYLHLPDPVFQELLDVYKDHPGFTPDLERVVTSRLRQRKEIINGKRVHDYRWLLRRIYRV